MRIQDFRGYFVEKFHHSSQHSTIYFWENSKEWKYVGCLFKNITLHIYRTPFMLVITFFFFSCFLKFSSSKIFFRLLILLTHGKELKIAPKMERRIFKCNHWFALMSKVLKIVFIWMSIPRRLVIRYWIIFFRIISSVSRWNVWT